MNLHNFPNPSEYDKYELLTSTSRGGGDRGPRQTSTVLKTTNEFRYPIVTAMLLQRFFLVHQLHILQSLFQVSHVKISLSLQESPFRVLGSQFRKLKIDDP